MTEKAKSPKKVTTKSERNFTDDQQSIGKACSNVTQRILSATKGNACPISFDNQIDLQHAGVLLAIPSLLSQGLLTYQKDFELENAYYPTSSVFLSLAILALLRIKTLAGVDSIPSGELGRVIGLDRIPEVKTLRKRIAEFSERLSIKVWANKLSKDWMEESPELSAILYIDGHVKLYHGKNNPLPKRYVSRMRLALSGTTDYWVNDALGQPFFVINKVIETGLIQSIKEDLLPDFNKDIPNQPTEVALQENKCLSRYMLVFDREGYSPDFFYDLWQQRIAICTYKKNVSDRWDENEFTQYTGKLPFGTEKTIELAERGVLLQNKGSKKKIWVREIRKKSKNGHQTTIVTTNYTLSILLVGLYMFARWGQENFFKYMLHEFSIDTLTSYFRDKVPATTALINPQYRALESLRKKASSKLNAIKVKFATLTLKAASIEEKQMEKYVSKKQELKEQIEEVENEVEEIKQQKKTTPRKILYEELPENELFENVINQRKHFLDTIKIIAYRAETSLSNLIKQDMAHSDESRVLLKQIYKTDADLIVDEQNQTLIVQIHKLAHWKDDVVLEKLCHQLNETQTKFPDSNLTLFYKVGSP